MRKNNLYLLIALTIIAGLFRFILLDKYPVSLNWDEVSHGYNAYSILKTGKDEWGISFPIIFRAFGDYKLPVYIYLTTIPVSIFGLSAFSVRFISAIAGTLAIPGIYLLSKILFGNFDISFKNKKINLPIISAFLLTFMPWHFFISRPALEANLALSMVIYGVYFLIKSLKNPNNYFPASILLGLSMHTYNTARVFVPSLLLAFIFIYRKKIKITKPLILSSLLIGIFFAIVGYQVISGEGTARYSKLNIITESTAYTLGQKRLESNLPPLMAKLIYNRPLYFMETTAINYLNYFSPVFFQQSFGAQSQFAIPKVNLLGFSILALFALGMLYSIQNFKGKEIHFLFIWLFLSPVAASITVDPPQALRPNPMIPAITIISSLGLVYVIKSIKSETQRLILFISILLATVTSFLFYLQNYTTFYAKEYSESWQYGYSDVFAYLNSLSGNHKIIMSKRYGEPHIFYSFYNQVDPHILQDQSQSTRFFKSDWYWTDRIGSYYFVNDYDIPLDAIDKLKLESGEIVPTSNSILVTSPDHIPANGNVLKKIKFLDNTDAFVIVEMP